MSKFLNQKRSQRVRSKLKRVNANRFRISIYRSARNISAQIIDDKSSKTLVSATSIKAKIDDKKKNSAAIYTANLLAKRALEKKITNVYFDRGRYKFHGRIKVFAESLRKNGLNF